MPITGKDLIAWGVTPGPHFGEFLRFAQSMVEDRYDMETIEHTIKGKESERLRELANRPRMRKWETERAPIAYRVTSHNADEIANLAEVSRHVNEIARVPTVKSVSVMPDTCPTGRQLGSMPVGVVVETKNAIHPQFHSSDICCSVMMSHVGHEDPKKVLDAAWGVTHFGPSGRGDDTPMPEQLEKMFKGNAFLRDLVDVGHKHYMTQGDGNHFLLVGKREACGTTVVVTHHGSRKPGALLYKKGKRLAEAHTEKVARDIPSHLAWLDPATSDGEEYWKALNILRWWTKSSHNALHEAIAFPLTGLTYMTWQQFSPHNFVFRRGRRYFHAKGATPMVSFDNSTRAYEPLIPLNMRDGVLICSTGRKEPAEMFAPHGAGRYHSRTKFINDVEEPEEFLRAQTEGLDIRFWSGDADLSELPQAYKPAETIREQIKEHDLAEIVDLVQPYGCIMAGDFRPDFRKEWRM